jgi:hypothetical protein
MQFQLLYMHYAVVPKVSYIVILLLRLVMRRFFSEGLRGW